MARRPFRLTEGYDHKTEGESQKEKTQREGGTSQPGCHSNSFTVWHCSCFPSLLQAAPCVWSLLISGLFAAIPSVSVKRI